MNLVISKPVKCNCYSHVGCVLMIQTVQKLPHVFLSVYLSKDGFFNDVLVCVSTDKYRVIEHDFFFIYFFGNFPCFTFSINYHILLFPWWYDARRWLFEISFLCRVLFSIVACYNAELIVLSMLLVWKRIASYQFSISH